MLFLQVERAGLRGVHDRQPERRALVRSREVHLAAGDRERVVPKPTLTVVSPTRLSDPHVPASACASPHSFTPGISPAAPAAVQLTPPAALLAIFAVHRHRQRAERPGLNVRRARRQPGERQRVTACSSHRDPRRSGSSRTAPRLHRRRPPTTAVSADVVVYVPHNAGVASGALSVPKNSSFTSPTGSCGMFSNVVVNWPVSRFGVTFPASLTSTPVAVLQRRDTSRSSSQTGFPAAHRSSAEPPDTPRLPVRVPTTASDPHRRNLRRVRTRRPFALCSPICANEHACNPSAALGLTCTPAGNVTVVFRISASPSPTGLIVDSCGTRKSTFNPVGVLPASIRRTLIVGLKPNVRNPKARATPRSNPVTVAKSPGSSHQSTPTESAAPHTTPDSSKTDAPGFSPDS